MRNKFLLWMISAIFLILASGCSMAFEPNPNAVPVESILDEMEGPPKNGHTIERHVGKTIGELKERLQTENITAASTYYTKELATEAVLESLEFPDGLIKDWLGNSNRDRLVLHTEHSFAVGQTVLRQDMRVVKDVKQTTTVLAKDPDSELKYKIITSYPNEKRGN